MAGVALSKEAEAALERMAVGEWAEYEAALAECLPFVPEWAGCEFCGDGPTCCVCGRGVEDVVVVS